MEYAGISDADEFGVRLEFNSFAALWADCQPCRHMRVGTKVRKVMPCRRMRDGRKVTKVTPCKRMRDGTKVTQLSN